MSYFIGGEKMKYFIPIDRETIKKNPRAGMNKYPIPGNLEVTLHAENCTLQILEDDRIIPTEYVVGGSGRIETLTAIVNDPSFTKDVQKYTSKYRIEYHRELTHMETIMGEPDFFYKYKPVDVTCFACGATFPSDELQSDELYNGEGEDYSNTVCRKCGAFDCCDVEYESISAVQNIDSVI